MFDSIQNQIKGVQKQRKKLVVLDCKHLQSEILYFIKDSIGLVFVKNAGLKLDFNLHYANEV